MILKLEPQTLANEFSQLGIHPASEAIFLHKSEIVPLKILDIRTPAANIIKQEMLACGGDCAIPAGCVVCAEERVDVILLGTYKHYTRLLEKLTQMPYFGMAGIKSELMAILDAPIPQTILSDGRTLNYDKMLVMGILNITPDSFYAGSRVPQLEQVVEKAGEMLRQGAAVLDIGAYLLQRAKILENRGVAKEKIIFDPGIGFAKNIEQNLQLMQGLKSLTGLGYPVLLAASRKSTIGSVLGGIPAEERLEGTIAASCQAVYAGAQMVRVHDVQENLRAIRMLEAILCPSHI